MEAFVRTTFITTIAHGRGDQPAIPLKRGAKMEGTTVTKGPFRGVASGMAGTASKKPNEAIRRIRDLNRHISKGMDEHVRVKPF